MNLLICTTLWRVNLLSTFDGTAINKNINTILYNVFNQSTKLEKPFCKICKYC